MEVRGGEVRGGAGDAAVLSLLQVAADDVHKLGIVDEAAGDPVQQRGQPVDRLGDQNAAGLQYSVRLAERRQPLFARGQVVERSHQEHDIGAAGSVRQGAGIADGRACKRMFRLRRGRRTCLLHMTRHRIDQMHFVAVRGKPARIPAGAAADIQHHLRRRRQKTPDQLLHAGELRHPAPRPSRPSSS